MSFSERTNAARTWAPITPGANDIIPRPAAVWCGAAGTVTAVGSNGVSADFIVAANTVLPIQPIRITAGPSSLVALYN